MKKTIVTLAFALLVGSVTVVAQQPKGERPDQGKRMEQMIKDLDLTDKQAADFKAVMQDARPSQNGNSTGRPSREEMEKKRTETDAKIKKILTAEQYKKYQNMQPQRGSKK